MGLLDGLLDLLDLTLSAHTIDFFCIGGLQRWNWKVTFFALWAVRPAQWRCDQAPQDSHWTIQEPSSVTVLHLHLTFELLQVWILAPRGQSPARGWLSNTPFTVSGRSSGATKGTEFSVVAGSCGGVRRGWDTVERVEAGSGSTSREDGAVLFWGKLRVRIRTREAGKLLGDSYEREKARDTLLEVGAHEVCSLG